MQLQVNYLFYPPMPLLMCWVSISSSLDSVCSELITTKNQKTVYYIRRHRDNKTTDGDHYA